LAKSSDSLESDEESLELIEAFFISREGVFVLAEGVFVSRAGVSVSIEPLFVSTVMIPESPEVTSQST
jgi:hypothetical protein